MNYLRKFTLAVFLVMLMAAALVSLVYAQDTASISIGDSVEGSLTSEQPRAVYTFSGTAGTTVSITLNSSDFDAYLVLMDADGDVLAEDDDGGGRLNSLITFTLPADGEYTIIATSLREYRSGGEFIATGSYTLTLTGDDAPPTDDPTPTPTPTEMPPDTDPVDTNTISIGDTVSGRLTNRTPSGEHRFTASAGEIVTITLTSTDFDTYLILMNEDGLELQRDDDSAGNLNSRIGPFEIPADGVYTIVANSYGNVIGSDPEIGAYTLSLEAATIQTIEYTQHVSGTIDTENLVTVYQFDTTAGDVVTAHLETNSPSVYLRLTYAGQDFIQQTYGGSDLIGPIVVSDGGSYMLTVTSYDSFEDATYSLVVQRVVPNEISYGEDITASFSEEGVLYYTFEGQAGDAVDILVNSDGRVDTVITLNAPDGYELAYDDDGGAGFDPEIRALILPEDGTYSLLVRPFITGDDGEFTLVVENNALPSLDEGTQVVRISTKQAVGLVVFEGEAGQNVLLSARVLVGSQGEPVITVTQGNAVLATNSIGMVNRLALEFTVPDDGTVRVSVEDYYYTAAIIEFWVERLGE